MVRHPRAPGAAR